VAKSKEKIFEAARELFARHGYKETTTARIAERAGFSEAAIYKHYKNKQALLEHVVNPIQDKYVYYMNERRPGDLSGLACLLNLLEYHEHFLRKNTDEVHVLLSTYPYEERLRERMDAWMSLLEDYVTLCVRAGQKDGSIRADMDPHSTVGTLVLMLFGMARMILYWPDKASVGEDVRTFCKVVLRGAGQGA
jgi:AcrR family transcriptional regulator